MTPVEFVIWFKGFVEAANTYNITPKQWDAICEHLEKVKEPISTGTYTISVGAEGSYLATSTTAEVRRDVTYNQDESTTNTVF